MQPLSSKKIFEIQKNIVESSIQALFTLVDNLGKFPKICLIDALYHREPIWVLSINNRTVLLSRDYDFSEQEWKCSDAANVCSNLKLAELEGRVFYLTPLASEDVLKISQLYPVTKLTRRSWDEMTSCGYFMSKQTCESIEMCNNHYSKYDRMLSWQQTQTQGKLNLQQKAFRENLSKLVISILEDAKFSSYRNALITIEDLKDLKFSPLLNAIFNREISESTQQLDQCIYFSWSQKKIKRLIGKLSA